MDHKVTFGERVAADLRAFGASDPAVVALVAKLVANPEAYRRKNAVLAEFRLTLKACKAYPQAQKEILVTELEGVLDRLHIDSSDGLLNEWLQGISL